MLPRCFTIAIILLVSAAIAKAQGAPASSARTAIIRALPYLEKEGNAWMDQKKCISCHNVAFMIWTHNDAAARGLAVDGKKVASWTDWSWKFSRSLRSTTRPLEHDNDGGGIDTLDQLLLGRAPKGTDKKDPFAEDLRDLILQWQQRDGSWKAAGQLPLQHRPISETNAVTTMWTVLALASLSPATGTRSSSSPSSSPSPGTPGEGWGGGFAEPTNAAIQRAFTFLKTVKPGVSTESLIGKFLIERRFGEPTRANELRDQLLAQQNSDGGWSWLEHAESDPFATGQALYALTEAGESPDAPPIQRARNYLIAKQNPDGSWPVPPRAISSGTNDVRVKKLTPIYQYWGSAWAVIGLSHTLPPR